MSCLGRNFSLITLLLLFILVLGSCASTPEVNEYNDTELSAQESLPVETSTDSSLVLEAFENLESVRDEAISVKAPKAAPDEYNSGESYREEGMEFYKNNRYEDSTEAYQQAITMYKESITVTQKKREIALAALNSAEQAITQTEENANRALKEGEEEEL